MIPRIALAVLAVTLAVPAAIAAQERPTVDDALQRFAAREDLNKAHNDAASLLRQVHGPMTTEEIGALIEGLVEMALASKACANYLCSAADAVGSALRFAVWRPGTYVDASGYLDADDLLGVPLPEAFDALVRIYETLAARALAEGGDDPFLEAARRDHAHRTPDGFQTTFEHTRLDGALRHVFSADMAPGGRGWAYVLALFERSKPPCREGEGPPDCATGRLGSAWCAAGFHLHENAFTSLRGVRPWPGPDQDRWERRCVFGKPWNSQHD